MYFRQWVFYVLACFGCSYIHSLTAKPTIDDAYNLHNTLFDNYNRNVRPVNDQDSAVSVNVRMFIKSIQEFDDANERYSFGAGLVIDWFDDKLKWNESDYNGLKQITVPYDDVWVPELILGTPSNTFLSIGRSSDIMRVESTGKVSCTTAALIQSTCAVNVRNYPFDTQTCETSFLSLGYRNTEVMLIAQSSTISLRFYSPHVLWDITDTKVGANIFGEDGESELVFTVTLKRKPTLVLINIIMPIVLLSIVNSFVFLLVPESGGRVGFSITTLLAIAVYMTIVSSILPQNAEHVPLISYKLFVDLLISVLIVLCTILNLRLYHRADDCNVPNWLKRMLHSCTDEGNDQRQQKEDIQSKKAGVALQGVCTGAMHSKNSKVTLDGVCIENAEDMQSTDAVVALGKECIKNAGDKQSKDGKVDFDEACIEKADGLHDKDVKVASGDICIEDADDKERKYAKIALKKVCTENAEDLQFTWKKVSYMVDWIALFTFFFVNLMNCAVCFGIVTSTET